MAWSVEDRGGVVDNVVMLVGVWGFEGVFLDEWVIVLSENTPDLKV